MNLNVRAWNPGDIAHIVHYWTTLSAGDADRMGADRSRVPRAEEYARLLEGQLASSPETATAFYSMWVVDRSTIGYSSLKNIQYGMRGEMHLHIWDEGNRGKGIGGTLFCLSALDFYGRFNLREIVCEPGAHNPLPNRMLQKVGFPRIGSRVCRSSDVALEQEVNTYAVTREVALNYLAHRGVQKGFPVRG